jgi:hypothetical protein
MSISHLQRNRSCLFAIVTTKYENSYALVGDRSSVCVWCHEPEEGI